MKLKRRFKALTGKKYVLITSSCRSALYLAYKAIGKTGTVHTSPLTCKVALMPILASGNKICFQDVKANDWTLDPETIEESITIDSIAIQAIHLGGFQCDMPALRKLADEEDLVLIEDCAQGFGSYFDGIAAGTLGDISCFTLTKNLFGLGGGILATDNTEWFLAAKNLQDTFPNEKPFKLIYRILLAILSTYRHYHFCELLYQIVKGGRNGSEEHDELIVLRKELKKPPKSYAKSWASRSDKIDGLVHSRIGDALSLLNILDISNGFKQQNSRSMSSYVKLYILSNKTSKGIIRSLNDLRIEAMHLEHKHKVYFQQRLTSYSRSDLSNNSLQHYSRINDNIISLPIDDGLNQDMLRKLRNAVKGCIHEKNLD